MGVWSPRKHKCGSVPVSHICEIAPKEKLNNCILVLGSTFVQYTKSKMSTTSNGAKRPLEVVSLGVAKSPRKEPIATSESVDAPSNGLDYGLQYKGVGTSHLFYDGTRAINDERVIIFRLPGLAEDVPIIAKEIRGMSVSARQSGTSVNLLLPLDWGIAEEIIKVRKETIRVGSTDVIWRFSVKVQKMQGLVLQFE